MKEKFEQNGSENAFRSGYVTLTGLPNVGKSTLMNRIIGQKIAITSPKPQTTRNRIMTVYTSEKGQIIFMDTPGMHKAKNKLGEYMENVAEETLKEADIVMWLVEPRVYRGGNEKHIADAINHVNTKKFLVINKIDKVKPDEILKVIDSYKDICDFDEIIPVSARTGEMTDELIDTAFKYLEPGPMYYDEDTVTDQPERAVVSEIIREKALLNLSDEVPHGIAVVVDSMKSRGNIMDIQASVICERESHKGMIIGKKGAMLKKIGTQARRDMEDLLQCHVNLKIWVKVRKNWRDSDVLVKNFGYREDS